MERGRERYKDKERERERYREKEGGRWRERNKERKKSASTPRKTSIRSAFKFFVVVAGVPY